MESTTRKRPAARRRTQPRKRAEPKTVTVRELEKNTAAVLRNLADVDEPVRVTSRGQLVAWLTRPSEEDIVRERLIAEGVLKSVGPGGLVGFKPLPAQEGETVSETLIAMRAEDER